MGSLGGGAAIVGGGGGSDSGRRGLQICLGFLWLLDAALQFQPYMFGPAFVTRGIEPATAGNPAFVANSVTWVSRLMLHHAALYNTAFASIQLLLAVGFFFRRTLRPALAASVIWAVLVWWFGESLGGILTGASPLAGVPGAVVLYALIAIVLWPTARTPASELRSPATAGPLGRAAILAWVALWGSFAYYLLLPANRAPGAISRVLSVSDGQPAWVAATMSGLSRAADGRGTAISVALAVLCGIVALGVLARETIRTALVIAAALGLLFWIAEGFGAILTGQGTDPNSGPLLILLAACFWPRDTPSPAMDEAAASRCAGQPRGAPVQ
jgi:hypothetical protein